MKQLILSLVVILSFSSCGLVSNAKKEKYRSNILEYVEPVVEKKPNLGGGIQGYYYYLSVKNNTEYTIDYVQVECKPKSGNNSQTKYVEFDMIPGNSIPDRVYLGYGYSDHTFRITKIVSRALDLN